MNGITPQIAVLLVSTGAAVLMAVAGVQKSALEWKRHRRICLSCGREIVGRICGHHG